VSRPVSPASAGLNWGILTTGGITGAIVGALRHAERSSLLAIASRDQSRASKYADEAAIARAYGSYDELLEDPDIDVVYVPLPNALHGEWVMRALSQGKHVLCEKPLVTSVSELDNIRTMASASDLVVIEAFMSLHHPQAGIVKKMIANGDIGTPRIAQAWFGYTLEDDPGNVRLNSGLHGGSFWDVGVYPNSMLVFLLDGPPMSVMATKVDGASGVDVSFVGQMQFPGDLVAQIWSSFCTPFHQMVRVIGDQGTIEVPEPWMPGMRTRTELGKDSVVAVTSASGERAEVVVPAQNPFLCEVEEMERCVLDGKHPAISLEISRHFVSSAVALQQSARTAARVVLGTQ
jgi:xylose dehydrogenase (NAD/NADP)